MEQNLRRVITAEYLRDMIGDAVGKFKLDPPLAFYTIDNPALDKSSNPQFPAVVWRKPDERKTRNQDGGFHKQFIIDMLVVDSVNSDRSTNQSDRAHSRAAAWADEIHGYLFTTYERDRTVFRNETPDIEIGDLALTKRIDEHTELETGVRMLFVITDKAQYCSTGSFNG